MAAIFGERKFFLKNAYSTLFRYPVSQNFDEITLSRTVKEIVANLCFSIFGKNSKWPPLLVRGKFLKIAYSASLRYSVG